MFNINSVLAILSVCLIQILGVFPVSGLWCQMAPSSSVENPLVGTWSIQQVHWISADTTYSIDKAQPGYFMFGKSTYALMWTPTSAARTAFVNLSKPTEAEIISGFQSVVFNAGDYLMGDTTIVGTARIAKVPGFEGGQQYYRFEMEGQMMRLTMYDETYPDGSKPAWSGKFETQFLLQRTE